MGKYGFKRPLCHAKTKLAEKECWQERSALRDDSRYLENSRRASDGG
jgi:hypothetical protein